uniref:Uncharacterized protein n=1 Tax=Panagrolaimus superbus TaxID=310955 RepID=A0A914YM90_9BILA
MDPSICIILAYYSSLQNQSLPSTSLEESINEKDKELKQALSEYTENNKTMQKSKFLSEEFIQIIHKCLETDPLNENLLKSVIKYGYPLPVSVAPKIIDIINHWIISEKINDSGISLQVLDINNNNKHSKEYGNGEIKISVHPFNDQLFICQSDFYFNAGISASDAATSDNTLKAYFYEGIIEQLKFLKSKFPKQGESFREILLQNF